MSLAARAVQAAREVGAVQQEADSSITLGSARGYLSADDAGLDDLRAGLALATDIGAHFIALRAYVNISDVLELLGRHEEAARRRARGWRWPTGSGWPGPWVPSWPATWPRACSASAAGPRPSNWPPRR